MGAEGKIGLFGGSFDPVHLGHLILAQRAADFVGLDRVFFIPTAMPPHKTTRKLTPFEIRREMLELALSDNDRFELSMIENGGSVSYTYETINQFSEKGYGREQLHLLVGSDSLSEIPTWKNPQIIFSKATIVAMHRPAYDPPDDFPDDSAIIMINTGCNNISSSEIRRLVSQDRSIRYLVPAAVEEYIIKNALYRGHA